MKLYAVGGAVRDHLRGNQGKDFDFAVEAENFDEMLSALRFRGAEFWQIRSEFVTVRGRIPLDSLGTFGGMLPKQEANPLGKKLPLWVAADFTLCRKESMYHDNRHPSVVTPADILTDLARRDFTINAIAMTEDGTLIDPYDGRSDLLASCLRTVGDPRDRFEEDPLRILRAYRFSVTHALHIMHETRAAMTEDAHMIAHLPVERVREELGRAFSADWRLALSALYHHSTVLSVLSNNFPTLWIKPTTEDR